MINENDHTLPPAPILTYTPPPVSDLQANLQAIISEVLYIEGVEWSPGGALILATYRGDLIQESEAAYTLLDDRLKPLNLIPTLSLENDKHTIRILKGRLNPRPRSWIPNLVLFVLTLLSLLYVGASQEVGLITSIGQLLVGGPYAFGVLLILGSHELGHYFAARRHKVAVTLPYFIPMPLPGSFGTLGAFIQLREPMRNRKVLLDIGTAGPLIGLCFAIPVLIYGLATSPVQITPINQLFMLRTNVVGYVMEGNSILYAFLKLIVFGRFIPDGMSDVFINQLALAGWTGLLVTGLNLIPIGQLDGGHALYSLIGERARLLYYPFLVLLGVAGIYYSGWWLWMFLLLVMGRVYATPFDLVTPLDPRRRIIAVVSLIIFILVFTPIPLQDYVIRGWW
jgi:membrane-associated protease RseP (regulator of RpoE activity)